MKKLTFYDFHFLNYNHIQLYQTYKNADQHMTSGYITFPVLS